MILKTEFFQKKSMKNIGSFLMISIFFWFGSVSAESCSKDELMSQYLWNVLNCDKNIYNAYHSIFSKYENLLWIKEPTLGTPVRHISGKGGELYLVFDSCEPHNCNKANLTFIYEPATNRAWGRVELSTDNFGISDPDADSIMNNVRGTR